MAEILQEIRDSRTCPHCPKKVVFTRVESLKTHIEHCKKERPFHCELCGLGFQVKESLTDHEKIHSHGSKSFSCSVCKRKFHSRKQLSSHKHVVHEKPKFNCADCGQAFRWKKSIAGHCMKHLGLKPFKCSKCQK